MGVRPRVARDSKGNFIVSTIDASQLAIYDSTGRFTRALGTQGAGPGEFARIWTHTVGRGDTLHVFDSDNRRYSKVPPSGAPIIGYNALISGRPVTLLSSGEFVQSDSPRSGVTPLVVFAPDGTTTARIATTGAVPGAFDAGYAIAGDSAAIWRMPLNHYVLEKWSVTGNKLASWQRSVEWMPVWPDLTEAMDRGTAPAPAMMSNLFTAPDGRMWTLASVPDRNFVPLVAGESMSPPFMSQQVDTQVEVLDLAGRQVLASQRFPHYLQLVLNAPGLVYTVRYNADDVIVVDVFRLRITQ
jgi:hypothetical protein